MNVVLIGYRCSGKTSIGRLIAHKLGRRFVDTDDLIIKRSGSSISEMVNKSGWQYFRDMEKAVIEEISTEDNLIIATGGGSVTIESNMENLKSNGFIVWLDADIDTLKKRLKGDDTSPESRPSLTGNDPVDETFGVMEKRRPLYMKACNLKIDTSKMNINDAADMVIERLKTEDKRQKPEGSRQ